MQEQRKDWVAAADTWERIVVQNPNADDAFVHRVHSLSRAGVPYLAQRLAQQRPDLFSDDERYRLAHAAAALTLGFGHAQQARQDGPGRFDTTDLALQEQRQLIERFGVRAPTRFDQLLALRERERMQEAVNLYEQLEKEKVAIPPYARIAAAESYLLLRQPQRARDLLVPALRETDQRSELLDAQLTLVYAYMECEQPTLATQTIDQLLAATPVQLFRGLPGVQQANPDYLRVAVQAAMVRLYTDRIDDAEKRLVELRKMAPFNSEVRLAWAALQSARDHRRAARDEYQLMLVDNPDSVEAAAASAENLLALNDYAAAKAHLSAAQLADPENRTVQHLAQQLSLYRRPVFKSDLLIGRGGGIASAESVLDTSWYSSPLSGSSIDNLRFFTHFLRAQGSTTDAAATDGRRQSGARNRFGAGLSYRAPAIAADLEINRADGTAPRSGLALSMSAPLSDNWQVSASADSNVNTLAAAAYQAGTTARQWQFGLAGSANEARKAGIEVARTDYSDANRRLTTRLWWNERWLSSPVFKFDTALNLAFSQNRPVNTPYFNPAHDREVSLTAKTEWLTWRHYQRHFKQRLSVTGGDYTQSGFNTSATADAHYEHEWQIDDALVLSYGIGRAFHPYDGAREYRRYAYLNLNWNIP